MEPYQFTTDGPGRYGISFNGRVQVTGAHFYGGRSDVKSYVLRAVRKLNREHALMLAAGETSRVVHLDKAPYNGSGGVYTVTITPEGYSNV